MISASSHLLLLRLRTPFLLLLHDFLRDIQANSDDIGS